MADTRLFGHCKDRRRRHTLEFRAAATLRTQELGVGHCRTLLFGQIKGYFAIGHHNTYFAACRVGDWLGFQVCFGLRLSRVIL